MYFRLIGWNHYGFTNDAGKYIEGYKFHISRPSSKRNFQGEEVSAISVSEEMVQKFGEPKVGNVYDVQYDQNGRVCFYKLRTAQQRISGT